MKLNIHGKKKKRCKFVLTSSFKFCKYLYCSWEESMSYRLHSILFSHNSLHAMRSSHQALMAASKKIIKSKGRVEFRIKSTWKYFLSPNFCKDSCIYLRSRHDTMAQGMPAVWTASSHSFNPSTGASSWTSKKACN